MNDFETELRAGLHAAVLQAETTPALAERLIAAAVAPVRPDRALTDAGWRGWLVPLAAAAVAVAVTVGVLLLVSQVRDTSAPPAAPNFSAPPVSHSTSAVPVKSSAEPSRIAVPVPPITRSTSTAVTAGFRPVDVTFSTTTDDLTLPHADKGWVIGTAPCGSKVCVYVLRSNDAGATWNPTATPPPLMGPECSVVSRCLSIRADDYLHAIVYDQGGVTYQTNDGGGTWSKVPGKTAALDINDLPQTHFYGAVRMTGDCSPGCPYQLAYSYAPNWTFEKLGWAAGIAGDAGQVLIAGQNEYFMVYKNPAGGAQNEQPTLYVSQPSVEHRVGNPCELTPAGSEVDAVDMAAAFDGEVTVLCAPRLQQDTTREYVVTSADGGLHFSAGASVPSGTTAIASADGTVLFASTTSKLYRSADAGKSWAVVALVAPPAPSGGAKASMRMNSPTFGWWLPGYGSTFFTTSDTGKHWSARAFG